MRMKLNGSAARESLGLLGLSCLCGAGFLLVAHFKQEEPTQTVNVLSTPEPARSTVNASSPWALGTNSWTRAQISLSPKGTFVAGICPTRVARSDTQGGVRVNPTADLIIWRAQDRQEVACGGATTRASSRSETVMDKFSVCPPANRPAHHVAQGHRRRWNLCRPQERVAQTLCRRGSISRKASKCSR
jgi:hypothetical protein